ncbi:MAG: isoleucine--tRNA ligase [Asgard group archaeon]|nr:isoleucine--tRNA ligase [Asgard group archaeon]
MTKLETKKQLSENNGQNDFYYPEVQSNLDLLSLEANILQYWEENKTFEKRLALNAQLKKHYSFLDGPITANNPMGLHHVWGRTLKDLTQRYWAMKGYEQRYQNGFDCQGLWIEVEVEKALGLNSKKAIEDYGLEKFSQKCKERVDKYSQLITEQSKRLGQWMRWDDSYYTHTDTNISYIWSFLKTCYEKGWLIKGYYPMPWCTRCGTSLSQHEQHDSYKEMTHTAVFVKFPLLPKNKQQKSKKFLLVWTTTPWTLTSNTAAAVHPNLTYVEVEQNNEIYYLAKSKLRILKPEYTVLKEIKGLELLNWEFNTPFSYLTAQQHAKHKVIPWLDITEEEGTGIVHIAPGCGAEDHELSKKHKLSVLSPIDEYGIFLENFDEFQGSSTHEVSEQVTKKLESMGLLYKTEKYKHRYPTCWRCHEELVFRLVDEWFIDCNEIRPQLKEAIKSVEWVPSFYEKRMLDWLNNMGNWCISRKRYWGLPLPFFECKKCGTLTVIGSKEELFQKAVEGLENLQELHRPWIDGVKVPCSKCGTITSKVTEVGDCWLDAGIVPFSTLHYYEDNGYWQKWFPVDSVCEMREQIRLWFYSLLFMSVTLTGKAPYKKVVVHEKVHDKDGRPMHRSWGNAIWFEEAANKMGSDIMRWSFVKQPLAQTMNFGYNLETELKPFFLTIWNAYIFYSTFANLDQFNPQNFDAKYLENDYSSKLLDSWLLSLLNELVKEVRKNFDKSDFVKATKEIERFVESLSTWYIRRSRRRFWKNENSVEKASAYYTLYTALLTLTKLLAPAVPFFSEALYQNLTLNLPGNENPESVHLCSYPIANRKLIDQKLNSKMELLLELIKLGRAARNKANIRLRQPLAQLIVWCNDDETKKTLLEFKDEILQELNVKKLTFTDEPEKLFDFDVKLNYKLLGPKLKGNITLAEEAVKKLNQGELMEAYYSKKQLLQLNITAMKKPFTVKLNEELFFEAKSKKNFSVSFNRNYIVAFNTALDKKLLLEGTARDIVRHIQNLRKEMNLQVDDYIIVKYNCQNSLQEAMTDFEVYIKNETLAKKLMFDKDTSGTKIKLNGEQLVIALEKVQ